MKAFLAVKYYTDHHNRDLVEELSSVLAGCGMEVVCIFRDVEEWGEVQLAADELMRRTFEELETANLLVVELSEKGVGLGIEAGYAHAKGIPIVTVARIGSDISDTLRGISSKVLFYQTAEDLRGQLSELSVNACQRIV